MELNKKGQKYRQKIPKYLEINKNLNNAWVKEQVTQKTIKYSEPNESKNTTNQNLWAAREEVLRKIYSIYAYMIQEKNRKSIT